MRLEMPRFLTQGDTVTISGVVHNFLKSDKSTKISLDLNGAQLRFRFNVLDMKSGASGIAVETPRGAIHQAHAEAPLQLRKPFADRWRRHAKLARSGRQIAMPRHEGKQIQIRKAVHRVTPLPVPFVP